MSGLYDPRFEHDACGIGFVADAHGHRQPRASSTPGSTGSAASAPGRGRRRREDRRRRRLLLPLPAALPGRGPTPGADPAGASASRWLPAGRSTAPTATASAPTAQAARRAGPGRRGAGAARAGATSRSTPRPSATSPARTCRRIAQAVFQVPSDTDTADAERRCFRARKRAERRCRDEARRPPTSRPGRPAPSPTRRCAPPTSSPRSTPTWPSTGWQRRSRSSTSATRPTPRRPGSAPSRSASSATTARSTPSRATSTWMRAREGSLGVDRRAGTSEELLRPVIEAGGSDSAKLDNAVELLVRGGRDLRHAMAMLVPEVWEGAARPRPPACATSTATTPA